VGEAELVLFLAEQPTVYHTVSDLDGSYCIDDVPAGTYDLRVRRDDYMTTWIMGIEVADTVTSVDVSWGSTILFEAPWPNPVSGRVAFRFVSRTDAFVRLRVHDARGRFVRGWEGDADRDRPTEIVWDLDTFDGRTLPSGIYFVSLESGDQVLTHRFVRVR